MSHYKKLAKETLIYGLGTFIPRFLNFAFYTPYFTWDTLKEDQVGFGMNTEIYSYIMLLMVFLLYGMETAYFKFSNDSKYKENEIYNNVFSSIVVTTFVCIGLLLWQSGNIVGLISYGGSSVHIKLVGGILFFDVMAAIPFAKLRNQKKIIKFSILKILSVGANIGTLVFLFKFFPECENLSKRFGFLNDNVTKILVANVIASLTVFLLLYKEITRIRFKINWKILKPVLIYASPLLLSQLAGQINETLDKLLYRHLVDKSVGYVELGIYAASYKLGVILAIFNQMYRFASEPYFFSISEEKDSKIVYANMLKYFVIASLIIFLIINFYVDIFKLYLGPNYREGLFILPVVLLSYVLTGILININYWFKLSSHTKFAILIVGCGAVITVLSNLILVPKYHYTGSAWSHVIANVFMIIFSYFLGRKYYNIRYDVKLIGFYIFLAAVVFCLGYYIRFNSIILNYFYVTVLLLVYVLVIEKKEKILRSTFKIK